MACNTRSNTLDCTPCDFFSMDPLSTPHPVKANDTKPKINPKANQAATKMGTGEPQIQFRQHRVFGTARNINIVGKPVSDKSSTGTITKAKIAAPQKQPPKSIRATQLPIDTTSTKTEATDKKNPENGNPRLNKKSDALPQGQGEKPLRNSKEKDFGEPKTPVASTHVRTNKAKVPATPFYTAVHCSKCRFDRLETSSYWIGQIKLAESAGKHFIAADFFRLALESQAEPIRNLRVELRRYLLRHGYLSEQKEWREVAARYGLLKVESNNTCGMDSSTDQSSSTCRKKEGADGGGQICNNS